MNKKVKTGGRGAGTPNKLTRELKAVLKELLDKEFEGMADKLNQLETKDRLELIVKLLPFVLPKIQKVDQEMKVIPPYQDPTRPIIISVEGVPKSILDSK